MGTLQADQPGPGGDHDGALPRLRQQRPHLGLAAGVVDDHQRAAPGQPQLPGPARVGALRGGQRTGRSVPFAAGGGGQQLAQDVLQRAGAAVLPPQPDEQPPVREVFGQPVRGVDGERGLARAERSGHHRQPARATGEHLGQPAYGGRAPGERGRIGGQQVRRRRPGRARDRRPQFGGRPGARPDGACLAEQRTVEAGQGRTRRQTEFVGQRLPQLVVDGERLGAAPGLAQGGHLQHPQPFAQRVPLRGLGGALDRLRAAPGGEFGVQPVLEHAEEAAVEALRGAVDQRDVPEPVERRAAPQLQRLGERPGPGPLFEAERVELALGGVQDVAAGLVADPGAPGAGPGVRAGLGARQSAQPRDVHLEVLAGGARRRVLPQRLDQGVGRHPGIRVGQQRRQENLLFP